jgi:hypothetical protein
VLDQIGRFHGARIIPATLVDKLVYRGSMGTVDRHNTGATEMFKDKYSALGTFYALGNKFEVDVEYSQDMDGSIFVESATLIGIYLDNDKHASSLNHNIKLDLTDLSTDDEFELTEIATLDALRNGGLE